MHRPTKRYEPSSYRLRRMTGEPADPKRIINAPAVVTALIAVNVAVFALFVFAPDRLAFVMEGVLGLSPRLVGLALDGEAPTALIAATLATHAFLHGGLAHLAFNMLWLAAFGAPVARRLGAGAFLFFFFASVIAGAAAFLAAHWRQPTLLVGASGGVFGLLGAMTRFAFSRATLFGPERAGVSPITDRSVVMWTLFVLATNNPLAVRLLAPIAGGANIAWEAHLGGYLFGMLAFPIFDRASPARRADGV